MRKRFTPFVIEKLEVLDIASEGLAVARHNELVVFITNAIPGDVADIRIFEKKKSFLKGTAINFHKYSNKRTEAFCEHFGVCGGCKWQHLKYEEQLYYKQKLVEDNLERIGKTEVSGIFPIIPSKNTTYYRNKLEYTFSNKRWLDEKDMPIRQELKDMNALGFHIPRFFDKVLDIKNCYLQKSPSNEIRRTIKQYAEQEMLSFFDLRKTSTSELMLIMVFFHEDRPAREKLMNYIGQQFPQINSLYYIINSKKNDSITDQELCLYYGEPCIIERMEELQFRISPVSFYQTNSEQAYELYKVVRDFASLSGNELVYDLYTGTGTIANFIASKAKKVVGIEFVEKAIEDAIENAALNSIDNAVFYSGDIAKVLNTEFIETNGRPEVIITDPPRAGMHENVIEQIIEIVYVSCNPATQARDICLLNQHYKVSKIQPVDMFPHTHHVENVVLLERIIK
jgi:23S rRNA (uracil1939-C5)-methyltransferase